MTEIPQDALVAALDRLNQWADSGDLLAMTGIASKQVLEDALPALRSAWEAELLGAENIERAAAMSYEEFAEINLMPDEPRWRELEEEYKVELRDGTRENVRYAIAALGEKDR